MLYGTPSKVSNFAPKDVISSMPDNVITNILDRLPIQDAVKTGVLSKNWRFKWTFLTQLVFDENFFEYLCQPYDYYRNRYKYDGRDITRLLLHLKGPITKFVLYIPDNNDQLMDDKDIYHWVLFLSRKEIKDFTLIDKSVRLAMLPTQLFSWTELKHLKFESYCLRLSPSFSGFPNLLSLELYCVSFGFSKWPDFLARCPLLEVLKISMCGFIDELVLDEIAKLVKLKMLHLNWSVLNSLTLITKLSPLPKLQELTISFHNLMEKDRVEKLPTGFLCLKILTLSDVRFDCDMTISLLFKMICGFPNLQTLEITAYKDNVPPPEFLPHIYSMGQLQLQRVVCSGFRGSELEVYLIKSLLACSPLLKKIGIGLNSSSMVGGAEGKFIFANKLLKLYRASPLVEIDLY